MEQVRPSYAPLLGRLREHLDDLVAEVAGDVARDGEDTAALESVVRPVVAWTLDALTESEVLLPQRLATLRAEGAGAATSGESLQRLLDRHLSTGWVVWGAATRRAAGDASLPALGTALLKAGDAAAAAIADGFGEAERALALREARARREFVDELLDLRAGDADATARLRRRAVDFGLDPAAPRQVAVISLGRDVADGGPGIDAIVEALAAGARREPVFTIARRGHLVVVAPADRPLGPAIRSVLEGPSGSAWTAIVAESAAALTAVADAYAGARDALLMAERLGRHGLFQTDDLALERALAADERLLTDAVGRELGPILAARRNAGSLIVTLRAFLESGHNLRATARRLGLAPRTVAYRIERIERLLGGPVEGERALRVAAALIGARLLSGDVGGETASTAGAATRATAAGRSRPAPHGRSRNRRRRATAT